VIKGQSIPNFKETDFPIEARDAMAAEPEPVERARRIFSTLFTSQQICHNRGEPPHPSKKPGFQTFRVHETSARLYSAILAHGAEPHNGWVMFGANVPLMQLNRGTPPYSVLFTVSFCGMAWDALFSPEIFYPEDAEWDIQIIPTPYEEVALTVEAVEVNVGRVS
jgi:hypothetical protein